MPVMPMVDRRYLPETKAPRGLPTPSGWLHALGVSTVVAAGWVMWQRYLRYVATEPPRASTDDGVWFGWVAAILMTVLTLYGVRRGTFLPLRWQPLLYRLRSGSLQAWMWLHVYLSLLCALAIGCHIGWRVKGGLFYWLLMGSIVVAFLSGLFGVIAYTLLRELLTRREGQPLFADTLRLHRLWLARVAAHLRDGKSFAESLGAVEQERRETDGKAQVAAWLYELAHLLAKLRRTPPEFVREMERLVLAMQQAEDNERQWERWKAAAVDKLTLLLETAPEGMVGLLVKLQRHLSVELTLHVLVRGWIVVHALAAIIAFVLVIAHIVAAFYW